MILCIETATKKCSVALVSEGVCIAHRSQFSNQYIHGESLHVFIKQIMDDAVFKNDQQQWVNHLILSKKI